MTESLHVARTDRVAVDNRSYVEVEATNGLASIVGPGGLRLRFGRRPGLPAYLSATNHWPIGPEGTDYLTAILPNESLKHVDIVHYIETNGTVHELGDRLSIGWFVCELKRGAASADV